MTTLTLAHAVVPRHAAPTPARDLAWFVTLLLTGARRLAEVGARPRARHGERSTTLVELAAHYVVAIFVLTTTVVDVDGRVDTVESALGRTARFTWRVVVAIGVVALTWWVAS